MVDCMLNICMCTSLLILFPNLSTREIKVPQSRYLLNHLTLRHDKWFSFSLISA